MFAAAAALVYVAGAAAADPAYTFSEPEAWAVPFLHAGNDTLLATSAEAPGSGVCAFDYDGDSFEDLLFVNSRYADEGLQAAKDPRTELYRNNAGVGFTKVTSGLEISAWMMACATGDYDGDGDEDVALNGWGGLQVFRNDDGHFTNVTAALDVHRGVCGDVLCFGTDVAWFDYDRDGDLDMYVLNYVDWDGVTRATPTLLGGQCNVLWRNDGVDGFTDATASAGVADCGRNHLVIAIADIDEDGWQDLFVGSDGSLNTLFMNNQDGTFEDVTDAAGFGSDPRATMGAAWGDYDEDGLRDIAISYFTFERFALYRQNYLGNFTDEAAATGLNVTRRFFGWATEFRDYDNDGDQDLFFANGAANATFWYGEGYRQPNLVLRNDGGVFTDVSNDTWLPAPVRLSSRSFAFADFDRDGALDVAVTNNPEERVEMWRGSGGPNNWFDLHLVGGGVVNPHAYGALVEVDVGERTLRREVVSKTGYLGQATRVLHFGLGSAEGIDALRVTWPTGLTQAWRAFDANARWDLHVGAEPVLVRQHPILAGLDDVAVDRGVAVSFSAPSFVLPTPGPHTFTWHVEGSELTGEAIEWAFQTLGAQDVRVVVEDAAGGRDEIAFQVDVANVPPQAAIALPAPIVAGIPFTADGAGSTDADGTVANFTWHYEGGAVHGSSPTLTFAEPGAFPVTLTVRDNDGATDAVTRSATVVAPPPVATVTQDRETASRLDAVTFDARGSHAPFGHLVAWSWRLGSEGRVACTLDACTTEGRGAEASWTHGGLQVSHAFASVGRQTVTLAVTDDLGQTTTVEAHVDVFNIGPTARVTGPPVGNVHQPLTFTGASSTDPDGVVVAWSWAVDGAPTASGEQVVLALGSAGPHVVTLTVTDDAGASHDATFVVDAVRDMTVNMTITPTGAFQEPRVDVQVSFVTGAPVADAVVELADWWRWQGTLAGRISDREGDVKSGRTGPNGRVTFACDPGPAGAGCLAAPHHLGPGAPFQPYPWANREWRAEAMWRGNAGAAQGTALVAAWPS